MKLIALMLISSLLACANMAPTRADQVTVSARHLSDSCARSDQTVMLHIENSGATSISFALGKASVEPPYSLFAESFDLLFRANAESELKYWRPNFDHYLAPMHKFVLRPGTASDFVVSVRGWTSEDLSNTFVVRVFGEGQRAPYLSNSFTLCPKS